MVLIKTLLSSLDQFTIALDFKKSSPTIKYFIVLDLRVLLNKMPMNNHLGITSGQYAIVAL